MIRPHPTLSELIDAKSLEINVGINQRLPKAMINVNAIPRAQSTRAGLLSSCHPDALHRSWDSLDAGRRSAACPFEWARSQFFLATEVLPIFEAAIGPVFHVTVVDKRWRFAPSEIVENPFSLPRRKVRHAVELLRQEHYNPIYVVGYELSGDRNLSGDYVFEPHAHLLISGVPKAALKVAFGVRMPRAARVGHKPVRVQDVPYGETANVLSYITKIKAEDRVEFIRSDGRHHRNDNRMSAENFPAWLSCMAATPITHLIQFGGFAEPITSRFSRREMATMVGAIL
jgi:hypothetical protein